MDIFPEDEVKRKSFHLLSLLYIAAYWKLPKTVVLTGLALVIVFVLVAELIRLRIPVFNQWLLKFLGGVHREDEVSRLSGLPWTLGGSFLTIVLFPDKHIVLLSFLYLAFGDASAALFGKKYGRHYIRKGKTLEGSMACLIVCVIAGLFFLRWPQALFGALVATVVEIIPWPLNDNFWMPVISAAVLTLIVTFPII